MFNVGQSYTGDDLKKFGFNPDITGSSQTVGGKAYTLTNDNGMRRITVGSSTGMAPSLGSNNNGFDMNSFFMDQAKQRADQNASQKAQQDDFLNRYKSTIGNQETLPAMADRIGGELGLPALRDASASLTNTLRNIPTVQQNATRGFDVNDAQLSKIIGSEQSKIAPLAQNAVSAQQNAENNLTTQLGYGVQQQQKDLLPYQTEGSMLSDRLAREATGFNQDKENELQALLTKYQSDQALQRDELNRLFELTKLDKEYENQKQLIPLQAASNYENSEKLAQLSGGISRSNTAASQAGELNNAKALEQFKQSLISSGISNNPYMPGPGSSAMSIPDISGGVR